MRSSRFFPALAAGALFVAACGGSDGSGADATTAPAAEPAPESVVSEDDVTSSTDASNTATDDTATDDNAAAGDATGESVPAAPAALQFSAPLVGGGEIDATTLSGKPTLFWFWSPT